MRLSRFVSLAAVLATFALFFAGGSARVAGFRAAPDIPARLTDQEFWKLSADLSEPDGTFRSDNVLSNEMVFARLIPEVVAKVKPGGVYMGVGPEQNFSYIVAMRARMAFITDIRRNNLHVLLVYKALFEMSKDRADFVSRLFTKARPAGLTATSSVKDIFTAFWDVPTGDEAAYTANLNAILNHLTKTHGFPLPQEDKDGVGLAYRAFYWYGPRMNYSANLALTAAAVGGGATYADLMMQTDADGKPLSYLASNETFTYMKDLESRNMIVPIVGNFSGPKAIRAIGDYIRSRGATVAAFYVSSVEPYLQRDGSFPTYCASVATLPMDDASAFIRAGNIPNLQQRGMTVAPLPPGTPAVGTYQVGVIVPLKTGCQ